MPTVKFVFLHYHMCKPYSRLTTMTNSSYLLSGAGVLISLCNVLLFGEADGDLVMLSAEFFGVLLFALLLGAVLALILIAFTSPNRRTRQTFFRNLIVAFFLSSILGFASAKHYQDNYSENSQPLSSAYISYSRGFKVDFPTQPTCEKRDYAELGLIGDLSACTSLSDTLGDKVSYQVLVNNLKILSSFNESQRNEYYEKFAPHMLQMAGATSFNKAYSKVKNVYGGFQGLEFKYYISDGGERSYYRGIVFISGENAYHVVVVYPAGVEVAANEAYSDFVSSFALL